jgi:hypothetical protein
LDLSKAFWTVIPPNSSTFFKRFDIKTCIGQTALERNPLFKGNLNLVTFTETPARRWGHSVSVIGSDMYVCYGVGNYKESIGTMHKISLDPNNKKAFIWEKMNSTKLKPKGRDSHSCIVVRQIDRNFDRWTTNWSFSEGGT